MDTNKEKVKSQFGLVASGYVHSEIHAKGQDLKWIVEEIHEHHPYPLLALDVATGTGHTAFALSTCVGRVIGMDLTPQMIHFAQQEATRLQLSNVTWMIGDAEQIPLPDRLIDIATCRIAAHHFAQPLQAFKEIHRVLSPKGIFILIDNYSPDLPEAEHLFNQIERLRDPSHVHVHPIQQWSKMIQEAGFSTVQSVKTWQNLISLENWIERAKTPNQRRKQIVGLLTNASKDLQQLLGFDPASEIPQIVLRKSMWIAKR
jgi:ubiquinone/menaquinone biosynthesis C-methylase UbiE